MVTTALPRSRYFALTWSIPDNFGGMTAAMLERSRGFAAHAGSPVTVLTFDARADYAAIEQRMRADGSLVEGVTLLNLWDWLRDNPEADAPDPETIDHGLDPDTDEVNTDAVDADTPGTPPADIAMFSPLGEDDSFISSRRSGIELTRTRFAADASTPLQVDYYREDGTLLASDRRDVRSGGVLGGRSIVLCDSLGTPVRGWKTARAFYHYWIDRLVGRSDATLLIDSKTVAAFMVGYRRPRVQTIHIVHSSHLVGTGRPIGPIRQSRAAVFAKLDGFDAVVLLTERQRDDVIALLGPQHNLFVVPNGRDVEPGEANTRPPRGAVVSSLTDRKRVDHAIRAVARSAAVTELDVYGDGEWREELERVASEAGQAASVRFHGYVPQAGQRFRDASFMLLTSTSEGFPLVLVEAMASGCVPIAYDVPYGPADLIRDGENGYLVAPSDIDGLAAAIDRFIGLPAEQQAAVRARAIATASAFTEQAVLLRWAKVLAEVHARRQRRSRGRFGGRVVRRLRRIAARYRD